MTVFTRHTRMPLERAVEVLEDVLSSGDTVLLNDLRNQLKHDAPEVEPLLEHTIKVMIHGGYVRRVHLGPDRLAYQKTGNWESRSEALNLIRARSYKKRYRPRVKGKLVRPAMPTIQQTKVELKRLPVQTQLFGKEG